MARLSGEERALSRRFAMSMDVPSVSQTLVALVAGGVLAATLASLAFAMGVMGVWAMFFAGLVALCLSLSVLTTDSEGRPRHRPREVEADGDFARRPKHMAPASGDGTFSVYRRIMGSDFDFSRQGCAMSKARRSR